MSVRGAPTEVNSRSAASRGRAVFRRRRVAFACVLATLAGCASATSSDVSTGVDAPVGTDAPDGAALDVIDGALPDSAADARACPSAAFDASRLLGASSVDSLRGAPLLVVGRVTRIDEECSGAGGTHITLDLVRTWCGDSTGVQRIALGDHAFYAMPMVSNGAWLALGAYRDSMFSSPGSRDSMGWCLVGLPTVQAVAAGWYLAASESDALRALQSVAP